MTNYIIKYYADQHVFSTSSLIYKTFYTRDKEKYFQQHKINKNCEF